MSNSSERDDHEATPYVSSTENEKALPREHPEATKVFACAPFLRYIPVFGATLEGYGVQATLSLGASYFFLKGLSNQMLNIATYAMLVGRFGVDAMRYQRLSNVGQMGWSLNSFTAMLCDLFALFGFTKRWYMVGSCLFGGVFALVYALLPAKPSSGDAAGAFIFLSCFGKANVDILSEGHYTRMIHRNPKPAPAMVSWIWWSSMLGTIVAAAINGPLSQAGKQQDCVITSAALQFACVFLFIFNFYGEKKNQADRYEDYVVFQEELVEAEKLAAAEDTAGDDSDSAVKEAAGEPHLAHKDKEAALIEPVEHQDGEGAHIDDSDYVPPQIYCGGVVEMNKSVFVDNWKIFIFSIIMTLCVIALTVGNIKASTLGLLIICCCTAVVCMVTSFLTLPFTIAKANVFGFLDATFNVTVWAATVNFFMATPDCIADGPHFNYIFYNTVGPIVGNVAGLVGVAMFYYMFANHSYRLTFVVTTFINIIGNVFDIVIVKRWNIYIGIPDHAMYLLGNAVIYDICYMIAWMPMIVLISRLCPRGSESMVFAIMASFRSLGQSTAGSIGAIIMEYRFPVYSIAPDCDFSNVPWLLFVTRIMCPLLSIPFVFLLIPRARICDEIDLNGKVIEKKIEEKKAHDTTDTDAQREPTFSDKNSKGY